MRKLGLLSLSLVFFLAIDSIWIFGIAMSLLKNNAAHLSNPTSLNEDPLKILFALITYLLIVGGILYFISLNFVRSKSAWKSGTIYGVILYGVYELTNFVALDRWPYILVILDIIWGGFICGLTAQAAKFFNTKFFKISPVQE